MNARLFLILFCITSSFHLLAQPKIRIIDSTSFVYDVNIVPSKISFRGLSVVNDSIIWVSGSKGTIALSTNSGNTFTLFQIPGFEKSDFRDIEAFDAQRAIIMSSGSPAYILKTVDGGATWNTVYKNTDSAYFLDAMDFWRDKYGVIIGDPINNHFVIIHTTDGGDSWQELDTTRTPRSLPNESLFAASGTAMRTQLRYGEIMFVTGGNYSRIFGGNFTLNPVKWQSFPIPIVQGSNSKGAFSFAHNDSALIVVGGDYLVDTSHIKNSCAQYMEPGRKHSGFDKLVDDVKGYRSCIEPITRSEFIACGTSGVDYYQNKHWKKISNHSFNVVKKAKNGSAVYFAGSKGLIGKLY